LPGRALRRLLRHGLEAGGGSGLPSLLRTEVDAVVLGEMLQCAKQALEGGEGAPAGQLLEQLPRLRGLDLALMMQGADETAALKQLLRDAPGVAPAAASTLTAMLGKG
jgi:hypothetical protein